MKDNLARQTRPVILDGTRRFHHQHVVSIIPEMRESSPSKTAGWQLPVSDETVLWVSSLLIVLVALGAPLAWWLIPERAPGIPAPPPAAMVVELAPAPVAPASQPEQPPGPEQADTAPPPKPEPPPTPEPEPEIPPAPPATKPEVAVNPKPEPKPEKQEQPKEVRPQEEPEEAPPEEKPASTASAPPDAPQEDVEAAAPDRGISAPMTNSNAIPTWQNSLMLKLNEAKRYPTQARRYRQEGVAYLRFTMDRDGNVLAKAIEQSTGYPLLDEETLTLIERAQPLPKPPAEMPGEQLEFVVPVEFFLNR
ncbi:energy transducer TonB family protein [Oceanobacter antarcticus]|uniref:Energy transducer TonB n=1 Tax=Oceanobacter antarcticus TaxID=3133425 RepID=A0ABW8NFP3_9GAMM